MHAQSPIRAVLFDLDGTLLDSYTLIAESFRHACRAVLGREISDAEIVADWGAPLRVRFQRVRGAAPSRVKTLMDAYLAYYDAQHDRLATLFPGVLEMLEALKRRGCHMGLVTSKRRYTTRLAVQAFALGRFFDAVVSEQDVPAAKPAPDPVLKALRDLDAQPHEALMVGDAVFDIQAARAAGVASVAALWGSREIEAVRAAGPDYEVASPNDVAALIGSGRR